MDLRLNQALSHLKEFSSFVSTINSNFVSLFKYFYKVRILGSYPTNGALVGSIVENISGDFITYLK